MLAGVVARMRNTLARGWDRVRARRAIKAGLFRDIDVKALGEISGRYEGHGYRKYYDRLQHTYIRNAQIIFELGLQNTQGRRILDLGCGFGLFLYAAERFGHTGVGLDQSDDYLNEVTALFGLKKIVHTIQPHEPLPDLPGGPFDLITAFQTGFDRPKLEGQWGREQWAYFLDDLRRFVAPNCLLHVKFNQYTGGCEIPAHKLRPIPQDLYDYFLSIGGVFFKRAMQLRLDPR